MAKKSEATTYTPKSTFRISRPIRSRRGKSVPSDPITEVVVTTQQVLNALYGPYNKVVSQSTVDIEDLRKLSDKVERLRKDIERDFSGTAMAAMLEAAADSLREAIAYLDPNHKAHDPEPKEKRVFGAYKGKFSVGPEFFDPLPPDELKAWGED